MCSCKDRDWESWNVLFVPFASSLSDDMQDLMIEADAAPTASSIANMTDETSKLARKLYSLFC